MMKITLAAIRGAATMFGNLPEDESDTVVYRRRFRALFGCTPGHVRLVWNLIDRECCSCMLNFNEIGWLLAALNFLRNYPTTEEMATRL